MVPKTGTILIYLFLSKAPKYFTLIILKFRDIWTIIWFRLYKKPAPYIRIYSIVFVVFDKGIN